MKKIIIISILISFIISCSKDDAEFNVGIFPGFTGAGEQATWVVYTHTITDRPFVSAYLLTQTPPSTIGKFDTSYIQARQREVTPYTYRFYKGGEVGLIGKSASNENIWIKMPHLKWQEDQGILYIMQNINGSWVNTITCFKDQTNLLFRFKKSYFGDTSADKDRYVMEVLYTMFK